MTTYQQILTRLIEARKAAHLTQADVAAHLHLSTAGFADIENRRPSMSVERLLLLTDLYGVSIEWVMTGIHPSFNSQQVSAAISATHRELQTLMATLSNSAA